MWVGPVGSGKTYNAVADALEDAGDFITTNTPIDETAVNEWLAENPRKSKRIFMLADGSVKEQKKTINLWQDFNAPSFVQAKCGVIFIDEAPMWLDARKFDVLSQEAKNKLLEHRKDDAKFLSTSQDVSFIDKIFRILADEIRIVRQASLPIVGWLWPTCVRPTIVCFCCGRIRRDGLGDDHGWRKYIGLGTLYTWSTFKAKDLLDAQDATGEAVEARSIGGGMRLFNIHVAAAYSTSLKLSATAKNALAARRWKSKKIVMSDQERNGSDKPALDDIYGGNGGAIMPQLQIEGTKIPGF